MCKTNNQMRDDKKHKLILKLVREDNKDIE